jgi:predicted CXXCH cytochrome family protein
VPQLCFKCHKQGDAFASAHQGRQISDANCVSCHAPHASNGKGLLRQNKHAPFAAGNCARCHPGTGGGKAFAIAVSPKDLCTQCHKEIGEGLQTKPFHHNLDDPKSCLNCHNPHASNPQHLLLAEQKVLCMRCHFNDTGTKDKASFITHGGMDCSNCHAPHGADNEKYLKAADLDLCFGCHESAHKASHPVGPGVIDKRTGKAVTCLSCHKLHGADFDKYLPLDPKWELCIQCHKR